MGKIMKFNHSLMLVLILIILFSLGTVVANDNVEIDASINDTLTINNQESFNQDLKGDIGENQFDSNYDGSLSSADENDVDVSVRIDVKNVYDDKNEKFNQPGFIVPWNITVKVTGGTAHNVKVHQMLSNNMEYLSSTPTVGEFNPASGIWNIGELSDTARLTIVTKLKSGEKFTTTVDVTTDSNDIKLSNNHKSLYIKSGSSKSTSNVTETTDGKTGAIYNNYKGDLNSNRNGIIHDKSGSDSRDSKSKSNSNNQNRGHSGIKSVASTFSRTFRPLISSIVGMFDSNSSVSNDVVSKSGSNVPNIHVEGIVAQDYTTIPILIFTFFLVMFVAIVSYDKIKS